MHPKFKYLSVLLTFSIFSLTNTGCVYGGYKNISPAEAKKMIEASDGNLLILDVRTEGEYNSQEGHIEGAKLIPIQVIDARLGEIENFRNSDIIVYCAVGGRSSRVSSLLAEKGFQRVYNMTGGIREWNRLGFKTVR